MIAFSEFEFMKRPIRSGGFRERQLLGLFSYFSYFVISLFPVDYFEFTKMLIKCMQRLQTEKELYYLFKKKTKDDFDQMKKTKDKRQKTEDHFDQMKKLIRSRGFRWRENFLIFPSGL